MGRGRMKNWDGGDAGRTREEVGTGLLMECRVENNGGHRAGEGKEFVAGGEQVDSNFFGHLERPSRAVPSHIYR
ncbi:hypothetical protein MAPG_05759 [Magnaporthiopsis poae ATCC 64411]|uniref:Uncharacterized protein n=1 Tax=Magnaporthiopsis poae (strain ATCC 64411 / 73-15) TaxID=644358 RepID=A0A0C4E093_MAGP6|nr:hypothetical protein MAPG_05759 [Magnaporthiopsis poae ATCC 64411]